MKDGSLCQCISLNDCGAGSYPLVSTDKPLTCPYCYINNIETSLVVSYQIFLDLFLQILGYANNTKCQLFYLKNSRRPSRTIPSTGWE